MKFQELPAPIKFVRTSSKQDRIIYQSNVINMRSFVRSTSEFDPDSWDFALLELLEPSTADWLGTSKWMSLCGIHALPYLLQNIRSFSKEMTQSVLNFIYEHDRTSIFILKWPNKIALDKIRFFCRVSNRCSCSMKKSIYISSGIESQHINQKTDLYTLMII